MNIEKSLWTSNGNDIALSVPFTKVNREKRTDLDLLRLIT